MKNSLISENWIFPDFHVFKIFREITNIKNWRLYSYIKDKQIKILLFKELSLPRHKYNCISTKKNLTGGQAMSKPCPQRF
jgi:hypothetical protein